MAIGKLTLKDIISHIRSSYIYAIKKPVSFALYETWKLFDFLESDGEPLEEKLLRSTLKIK